MSTPSQSDEAWVAETVELMDACAALLPEGCREEDIDAELLMPTARDLHEHLVAVDVKRWRRSRARIEALKGRPSSLLKAVQRLNTALMQSQGEAQTSEHRQRRAEIAYTIALIPGWFMDMILRGATPAPAVLQALGSSMVLSLEAGAATVSALWADAQAGGTSNDVFKFAGGHVRAVDLCLRVVATSPEAGAAGVAASQERLLYFLEAAVLPYLTILEEDLKAGAPSMAAAVHAALYDSVTAESVVGILLDFDNKQGPGAVALAARPDLHSQLVRQVVTRTVLLAAQPEVHATDRLQKKWVDSILGIIALTRLGEDAPPWAPSAMVQTTSAFLKLGAIERGTQPSIVAHFSHASGLPLLSFIDLGQLWRVSSGGDEFSIAREGASVLSHLVAGLMLAVEPLFPELRFEGALAAYQAPLVGADAPWGSPLTEHAPLLEVLAAAEGAARLQAFFLVHHQALPRELQGLGVEKTPQHLSSCMLTMYFGAPRLQMDADGSAGQQAEALSRYLDAAASASKLLRVMALFASASDASSPEDAELPTDMSMLAGPALWVSRHRAQLADVLQGTQCQRQLHAAVIVLMDGVRALLSLPRLPAFHQVRHLRLLCAMVCYPLCPTPEFVHIVEAEGGFDLLARQVAVVFDPSAPGAVLDKAHGDGIAALATLHGLNLARRDALGAATLECGSSDCQSAVYAALAATPIPATLAAWAAAALRSGRRSLVQDINPATLKWLLREVWTSAATVAAEKTQQLIPGVDLFLEPSQRPFTAAEYDRIATDIMPKAAQLMRSMRSVVSPDEVRRRAVARARALATRPCANPACLNVASYSERDLPGKKCSGCVVARYCCRACQKADWKAHKAVCAAMGSET